MTLKQIQIAFGCEALINILQNNKHTKLWDWYEGSSWLKSIVTFAIISIKLVVMTTSRTKSTYMYIGYIWISSCIMIFTSEDNILYRAWGKDSRCTPATLFYIYSLRFVFISYFCALQRICRDAIIKLVIVSIKILIICL